MILIVGARGKLGGQVARRLLADGVPVRAPSRSPDQVKNLAALGAETVRGDLRDPASLARACAGAAQVLAAAHAFSAAGRRAMARVDDAGNRALIDAARAAGVGHFVFTSACTGPADPVDFFRVKYRVEQHLRASGMPFTILRPGAFMEDHAEMIGRPVVRQGWTLVFLRGDAPANYVAVRDVAELAVRVLREPPRNGVVPIGGPENLSVMEVVRTYERVSGRTARVVHLPESVVRGLRRTFGRAVPVVGRILDAGLFRETGRQTIDMRETLARYPIRLTPLEDFVRERYAR